MRCGRRPTKTKPFIQKAVEVASEQSEIFAPAFLEELRKDGHVLGSLPPTTLAIQTPAKRLHDTTLQLGGENFVAARTILLGDQDAVCQRRIV